MNGYRIAIARAVYHNDKFIINNIRYVTIHARNETESQIGLPLEKEETTKVSDSFTVRAGQEWICGVEYLGRVIEKRVYDYVKD